jgi:GNAT superfamily N-acetyltransferase
MSLVNVERTYLEMTSLAELRPARSDAEGLRLERLIESPPAFYRFLYAGVGSAHNWVDRIAWSDEQIRAHVSLPEVEVCVLYCHGAPAGYFELMRHADGAAEIAYFGLFADFHGRGLGGYLLTLAIQQAWRQGTRRVWLHTCSLDHPAALPNYEKRGFRPVKREIYAVRTDGLRAQ